MTKTINDVSDLTKYENKTQKNKKKLKIKNGYTTNRECAKARGIGTTGSSLHTAARE